MQVFPLQQGIDLWCGHLQAHAVGFGLYHLAELDLHEAWQADVVFLLQQVGDAAFARLAVYPNHRHALIAAGVGLDQPVALLAERNLDLLGMIIDGGYGGNKASTVINLADGEPEVVRVGCGDPTPFMVEA